LGMAKLGGRSPERGKTAAALDKIRREVEASGGWRQRSRHGNSGEGCCAREGGGGEELVMGERMRGSVMFERLGRRRGREVKRRGERGSSRGGATRREGDRGAWPRPAGDAPTVSRPPVTRARRARVARRCSDKGAPGIDGRAPVAVRVGREQRGARVGLPEKKTRWPSPDEQYGLAFIQINSSEFKLI
jgi:hypothetical protein